MLMDPISNIYRVYSLLVQQETQTILPLDEPKVLTLPNPNHNHNSHFKPNSSFRGRGTTRGGIFFGGRGRGTRVFTHCRITNHTIDSCFKKHDFPPH